MHGCVVNKDVDDQEKHPLDCVLQYLPLLWRQAWNLESVLPLDAYLHHPKISNDSTWKEFPGHLNLGMNWELRRRHDHFFHKDWHRKHNGEGAKVQWLRFLDFNGIEP